MTSFREIVFLDDAGAIPEGQDLLWIKLDGGREGAAGEQQVGGAGEHPQQFLAMLVPLLDGEREIVGHGPSSPDPVRPVNLDHVPPLPTAIQTSTEMFICPWCRCLTYGLEHPLDENGAEMVDRYLCGCGGVFEVECYGRGDPVAWGCRSAADVRYMEAMGITEAAVAAHHAKGAV